ncbi:MAG: hypothetical protein Q8J78_16155 [Moraxellaceae bacterium]|nr:hypothetical protein [Moraxellaceae bacterium]
MAYVLSWCVYLLMAVLLMVAYERYVADLIGSRQWRVALRAFIAIVLFTPGFTSFGDMVYMVPACIAMLYHLLAKSGIGFMKASLPILLVSFVVYGVLFFRAGRQPARPD